MKIRCKSKTYYILNGGIGDIIGGNQYAFITFYMFKDKVLLITGGTGSFGNAVLGRFLDSDLAEIRIFSRDEKKQEDMRIQFKNEKIKFYIGDVRTLTASPMQ